jgi:hypothetical protein
LKPFSTDVSVLYTTEKDEGLFKSFVTKNKAGLQFAKQDPQTWFQDTLVKLFTITIPGR